MSLPTSLAAIHARVRRIRTLRHFTAFTRVLLAVGFIPPGLVKVLGIPFTSLPPDHPVGYFFSAFHRAGLWYHFVGWGQITAATLLLFPRTATLGAVLYFPIIVNIAFVTVSIDFRGTPVITLLMMLASLYLLCWDYDRIEAILPWRRTRAGGLDRRTRLAYPIAFAGMGVVGFILLASAHVASLHELGAAGALAAAGAGALFGLVCAWHVGRMPAPEEPASRRTAALDAAAGATAAR